MVFTDKSPQNSLKNHYIKNVFIGAKYPQKFESNFANKLLVLLLYLGAVQHQLEQFLS